MGRSPCCDKAAVKRGPWSEEEDARLRCYIERHGGSAGGGGGGWMALPRKAGLRRCGKSCRLRWLNYLRPGVRHGGFSPDEDRVICALYAAVGSRWSLIAAHLAPGRTDNGVKNYWNTRLKKRFHLLFAAAGMPPPPPRRPRDTDVTSAVPVPPPWTTTGLLPCGTGGGVDDTRIIGAAGGGGNAGTVDDDMVVVVAGTTTNAVVVSQLLPAETSSGSFGPAAATTELDEMFRSSSMGTTTGGGDLSEMRRSSTEIETASWYHCEHHPGSMPYMYYW